MSVIKRVLSRLSTSRYSYAARVLKNRDLIVPFEPITYNQDRLLTGHNCDFIKDRRFERSYRAGEKTGSWGGARIHWRAHIALWAADRAKYLEGDFVECGVNRGGLSRAVIEYIDFIEMNDRKFYLLDTFQGLAEEYISEDEKSLGITAGGYEECYNSVKETFKEFKDVIIVRGTVPETLPEIKSEKIAYLSIDMNCVEPEIAAAEYLWDRLVSGAAIVLDDYGWAEHRVQKLAFDAFAQNVGTPILSLPTGQGLILKP